MANYLQITLQVLGVLALAGLTFVRLCQEEEAGELLAEIFGSLPHF